MIAKITPTKSVTPVSAISGVRALRPRSASCSSALAVSTGCSTACTTSFAFSTGCTMSARYPLTCLAMHVHYDVVVAGGGTTGCVLAARLSEDPQRRVCLIEAGPDYGPYADGRWPADILDARQLALDSHCWERNDEDDHSQLRARILGGCSAHKACALVRGEPRDYDEW